MREASTEPTQTKKAMAEVRSSGELRECIKNSKGPWVVRRTTKKGLVTSLRFPTEGERDNNRERERKRRETTRKIYAGLRAHGNYQLRKHADNDDLLRALCEEAGWHVEKDGTIYRKTVTTISSDRSSGQSFASGVMDICGSIDVVHSNLAPMVGGKAVKSMGKQSVNLTLSLSLPYSRLEALGAVIN